MKIKESQLTELLVAIQLVLVFFWNYSENLKNMLYIPTLGLGVAILFLEVRNFGINKKIFFFILGLIIISMASIIVVGNINYSFIAKALLQYFPVAYFFAQKIMLNNKVWLVVSAVITVSVEISWITSPNAYNIMNGMSRNYVSIFLLIPIWVVTVLFERSGTKVPLYVPVLYLIFSISSIGRAGIIASLAYLGLYILLGMMNNENSKNKLVKILGVIVLFFAICVIMYVYSDIVIDKYFARFKDSDALNSNYGRMYIYMTYLNQMVANVHNFILGVSLNVINSRVGFVIQGNLHSSILQIHSSLGMLGFVSIIIFMLREASFLKKEKQYYSLILLITFFLRIAFDYAVCGFIGDIVLLYFIIDRMVVKKND